MFVSSLKLFHHQLWHLLGANDAALYRRQIQLAHTSEWMNECHFFSSSSFWDLGWRGRRGGPTVTPSSAAMHVVWLKQNPRMKTVWTKRKRKHSLQLKNAILRFKRTCQRQIGPIRETHTHAHARHSLRLFFYTLHKFYWPAVIEMKLIVNWRAFFSTWGISTSIWEMEPQIKAHEYKTSGELASLELLMRVHYGPGSRITMRADPNANLTLL